jgi:hypothetical protein
MSLLSSVGAKLLQWRFNNMLTKIMAILQGKKTYITALIGAILLVVGHFWGPISIAGISIPQVGTGEMWQGIWAALMAVFMRNGVTTSGPTPPAS